MNKVSTGLISIGVDARTTQEQLDWLAQNWWMNPFPLSDERITAFAHGEITKGCKNQVKFLMLNAQDGVRIAVHKDDSSRFHEAVANASPITHFSDLVVPKIVRLEVEDDFRGLVSLTDGIYQYTNKYLEASVELALADNIQMYLQTCGYTWVEKSNIVYRKGAKVYNQINVTAVFDAVGGFCWSSCYVIDNRDEIVVELHFIGDNTNTAAGYVTHKEHSADGEISNIVRKSATMSLSYKIPS